MKNEGSSFTNIGSSSLLVVFLVLALTTFATLSLSTARSNYTFSEELAGRKTAYYAAVDSAESRLAEIDEILYESYVSSGSEEEYRSAAAEELESRGYTCEDNVIGYTENINDTQYLTVELRMEYPAQGEGFYTIKTWRTDSSESPDYESTLDLISIPD